MSVGEILSLLFGDPHGSATDVLYITGTSSNFSAHLSGFPFCVSEPWSLPSYQAVVAAVALVHLPRAWNLKEP